MFRFNIQSKLSPFWSMCDIVSSCVSIKQYCLLADMQQGCDCGRHVDGKTQVIDL